MKMNLFGKLPFKLGDTIIMSSSDKKNLNCYYDILKVEAVYSPVRYKNAVRSKESELTGYKLEIKSWNNKRRTIELNRGFYTRYDNEKWDLVANTAELRGVKVGMSIGIL